MRLQLKDSCSGLILTGKIDYYSYLASIKSTDELFFRGQITSFNQKDGRYEVGGLSLKGRPQMKNAICANCQHKWKNCDCCYKADRDMKWHILPDGAEVKFQFQIN